MLCIKTLDPDPDSMNPDSKHCLQEGETKANPNRRTKKPKLSGSVWV